MRKGILFLVLLLMLSGCSTATDTVIEEVIEEEQIEEVVQDIRISFKWNEEVKQQQLIEAFFTDYYKGWMNLEATDYSKMIEEVHNCYLNEIYSECTIFVRKQSPIDLHIEYVNVELAVELNEENHLVVVEKTAMKFNGVDTESVIGRLHHDFVFNEKGIYTHSQEDSLYLLLDEAENVRQFYIDFKKQVLLNVNERIASSYLSDELIVCDHEFDRDTAVNYARTWVGVRNSEVWDSYDDYGGNCQNFVSQCLYEAGIPMDTKGSQQWKYYSNVLDTRNREKGRSVSWTGVFGFNQYILYNTVFGLKGQYLNNYYGLEPGDVIQMGCDDLVHSTMVVESIVRSNQVVDYLLCSNTLDYLDFPASALTYTYQKGIHISGWDEK